MIGAKSGVMLLAVGLLAGCACTAPAAGGARGEGAMELLGSATYLQRIALPPDAGFSARLLPQDGDRPLAETALDDVGQVPIDFALTLPAAATGPARLELVITAFEAPFFTLEQVVDTTDWAAAGRREFVLGMAR